MALCNPQIIEQLNHQFVPVFADDFPKADGGWTRLCPAGDNPARRLLDRVRARFLARRELVQSFIVSPDGEIADTGYPMTPTPTEVIGGQLASYLAAHPVPSGPVLGTYHSHSAEDAGPDGVALQTVMRYTDGDVMDRFPRFHPGAREFSAFVYSPDPKAPMREWILLTKAQWTALLPPADASVGATYVVDDALTRRLLSHFVPEPSTLDDKTGNVRRASLRGTLLAGGQVRLDASVDILAPGFQLGHGRGLHDPINEENWVEATLVGYLEYDPQRRALTRLELATEEASYRTVAGDRLDLDGIAYLVKRE